MLNFHDAISVIVFLMLTVLATSCSNKNVQCHEILEITRKAALVADTAKTGKREELTNIAKGLDKVATELATLGVKNGKLQVYQAGLVKSYRDTGQALRSTIAALDNPNPTKVMGALNSLAKATNRNQSLLEEMRAICPG